MQKSKDTLQGVGQPAVRMDARDKVTGKQRFLTDIHFPGALWAVVVRSPYARANVCAIDVQSAMLCPGIVAIYTANEIPKTYFNSAGAPPSPALEASADRLLLTNTAQHVGDGVAVVVAKTRASALAAIEKIRIDWEVLPPILSLDEALEQENILGQVAYGDEEIEAVIAAADLIVEDHFCTPAVQHICLEPHACAAVPELADGRLTIWSNTQTPSDVRRLCSEILGVPLTLLRVRKIDEGGGFGCKQELHEEALVAWLALSLGQAVQLSYTRQEEFTASRGRHAASVHVRLAFRSDGTLLGCDVDAVLDSGAYASHAPYVIGNLGSAAVYTYPYAVHRFRGTVVQTNTLTGGGYRGYGFPQANFAVEQAMDCAAQHLQLDPVVLRQSNSAHAERPDPFFGNPATDRLRACLDAGVRAFGWRNKVPTRGENGLLHADGMAVAALVSVTSPGVHEASTTTLRWNEDGSVTLFIGSCDCGTGSSTVMAQIVAEELQLSHDMIEVRQGDTDTGLVDLGSFSQRTVYVGGGSVRQTAIAAREQLFAAVEAIEKRSAKTLDLRGHTIIDHTDDSWSISVPDFCRQCIACGGIIATASHRPAGNPPSYGACFVTVAVDSETGAIQIERCVAATDCGRVLNPLGAAGQVYGGTVQGMGFATIECWTPGPLGVGPTSIQEHGVPSALDVPSIEICFVDIPEPLGPYGAKGLGEVSIVPVAAAIANAVARATGQRCTHAPLRPAEVWQRLQKEVHAEPCIRQ